MSFTNNVLLIALCSTLSFSILGVRYIFVDIVFFAVSKLSGSVSKLTLA